MTTMELPAGVGWTALLAAYGRAQELRETKPLFSDPLAAAFIDAANGVRDDGKLPRLGPAVDDNSSSLWNAFRFYFTQRTPFYDQRILRAVQAGCRQVVLLGAGLDSRAFRLGLPANVAVFEVDQSSVLDFKQTVLTRHDAVPTCRRVPLVADLLDDWPAVLPPTGFDPALPTLWVAEGVLMYLSSAEADRLLDRITALSAPGSCMLTEYFSRKWQDAEVVNEQFDNQDRAAWALVGGSFRYGPVALHPADWLSGHGWAPSVITTVAAFGRQSDRTVPPEFGRPGAVQVWLLEGTYAASGA